MNQRDNVRTVIERFGGIRPMAGKLDIAFTTVQGWKERGHIPPRQHGRILRAAADHGIALAPEDLAPARAEAEPPAAPAAPRPAPPEAAEAPKVPGLSPTLPLPTLAVPTWLAAALSGGGGGIAVLVLAVAIVLLTAPLWTAWIATHLPKPVASTGATRLAALEDRVDALSAGAPGAELAAAVRGLEARRKAVERALDALSATAAATEDRLGELAASIESLRAATARAPTREQVQRLQQALAELAERLDPLERRPAARRALPAGAALAVAVAQLRAVLTRSGPFAAELDVVRALAGDDPELDADLARLAAYAETGVPSLSVLEGSFGKLASAVAAAGAPAGDDWMAAALRRLRGLVSWRRVGERAQRAGGTEMRLAQAEAALGAGDLDAAVVALTGLDGDAAGAAAGWLGDARARLEADRAIAALTARTITGLSAGGG